jgi:hypothetical protein
MCGSKQKLEQKTWRFGRRRNIEPEAKRCKENK